NQVLATGTPYAAPEVAAHVLRHNRLDTIYTDITFQPQREADESISGILVVCTDVSQQVMARQEVKASVAKFQSLIEEAPVSTCLFVGEDMRIELINEVMLGYWGKDRRVIGKPLAEVLPELEGQPHLHVLQEVFTTGKTYEGRNVRADLQIDGQLKTFYFDLIYKPLRNAADEVYAIMDMSMDVTPQVLARQQLEESETKLRSVIEASPAAISLLIGADHIVESCNQAFIDIMGKGSAVVGKPLSESMPELITENQPFLGILDGVYASGVAYRTFDTPIDIVQHGVLKRGYYSLSYTPLFDVQGAVYAIVYVNLDVTEQVLARRKVEESELRYRTLSTQLEQLVEQRTEELAATNEELSASNEELLASYDEMTTTN
ncbi:MAG: PAS domain-containing protein, partial [Cytophagaceae bacterium]